jgi:hypothetical protein
MTVTAPLLDPALAAAAVGISVVPPREDGSKAPVGDWERWQRARATPALLRQWYANGRTGLGFVNGRVSGNLETLEFDDAPTYAAYKALAAEVGLGALVARIEAGYLEESPHGTRVCTPKGTVYEAPVATIDAYGFDIDYGHGCQRRLPLSQWTLRPPGQRALRDDLLEGGAA